jgi:eukaryotic translation initiation factor 2C
VFTKLHLPRAPGIGIPAPDARVTEAEDRLQRKMLSPDSLGVGALRLDDGFPVRPGYGTRGKEVVLWTNYFEMIPPSNLVLYRYHIDVQPAVAGKKLNQVVRLLLEAPGIAEYQDDIVSDFKSTLISRKVLDPDSLEQGLTYRAEGEDEAAPNAKIHRIKLEFTGTLTVSELMDYLASTTLSSVYADKLPMIQALNIFLGHFAKTTPGMATVGGSRTFFADTQDTRASKWDLGAGLIALRGFFSSVRAATCRILVNVNVSHAAFYAAIPLEDLIQTYGGARGTNLVQLNSFLKGVRVKTVHLPEKKNKAGEPIVRAKTIFGLAYPKKDGHGMDHPPKIEKYGAGPKGVEFFLVRSAGPPDGKSKSKKKGKKGGPAGGAPPVSASDGRYISVYDYFWQGAFFSSAQWKNDFLLPQVEHRREIKNPNIPVVNVGNRQYPSYLPAQVCVVLPGQSSQSKLDPDQTAQMINFAIRKPWENATSIAQLGPRVVGLTDNPKLVIFPTPTCRLSLGPHGIC